MKTRLGSLVASVLGTLLTGWSFISGKTLKQFRLEISRLESVIEKAHQAYIELHAANQGVVRAAVVEVLAEPREQLPVLRQLVADVTAKHKSTPLLIAALRANVPVWIYGDAGSGKTTAASKAADSLGLPFRFISVCPTTTKSELFGYNDAGGAYHRTAFREIFECGGVFLIDEIDNGNPSVLSVLNAALANGYCAFPDGNIKRHEDARFLAAANTIGRGADVRYVGRNAVDATTLDRFVFVRMDIDENFENALIGGSYDRKCIVEIAEGGQVAVGDWHKFVLGVRYACHELGIEHLVTPRATLYGQRLIEAGIGKTHLEDMCVWKGICESDRTKILEFLAEERESESA